MSTTVLSKSEILDEVMQIKKSINQLLTIESIFLCSSKFVATEAILLTKLHKKNTSSALSELILQFYLKAENISPGSGIMLLKFWTASRDSLILKDAIFNGSRQATSDDLQKIVDDFSDDLLPMTLKKSLLDAIVIAGFGGRLQVEVGSTDYPVVEKVLGNVFKLRSILGYAGFVSNPRILVIDGFIESVHEINLLLEELNSTGETLLIFARGYHNDVLNTFGTNLKRGTLKVYPFAVPYDLDGVNVVNDIAVVSNTDVVSSNKGQSISSIRLHELVKIDGASIWDDRLSLMNSKIDTKSLSSHVTELRRKRDEAPEETITDILNERLRSLCSGQVNFNLPKNTSPYNRQSIDRILRAVRCAVDNGFIMYENKPILATTALAVFKLIPQLEKLIKELGAIIVEQ